MYRLLLRLLPRHRRAQYGDEMEAVFAANTREVMTQGGRTAVLRVWMRELGGLMRFAWRERLGITGNGSGVVRDLRWAWRGVRGRGWTGALSIGLLGLAMAAATLVFASADALIFNRTPYPDADRLVGFPRGVGGITFTRLREQQDVLSHVAGHQPSYTFLTGSDSLEQADTAFVTPGFFETLGVQPRWGRPLTEADRSSISPTAAVITEGLARERFGSPDGAIGQVLSTDDRPLTVVGVMRESFRYPDGDVRIWRALDYERLNRMFPSMWLVGRLAAGVSVDDAGKTLATRLPNLADKSTGRVELRSGIFSMPAETRIRTLNILLGAALCLLLAACANVVSLEVAGGLRRSRVLAVQAALGASRWSLVRTTLLEGVALVGVAYVLALGLASGGISLLRDFLPPSLTSEGVNPLDVDWRAISAMGLVAAVVWAVASLPATLRANSPELQLLLKGDDRSSTSSAQAARLRRWITVGEVALSVLLLAGGLLYLRTYSALLAVDTGLQTDNVMALSARMSAQTSPARVGQIEAALLDRLRADPTVVAVSRGSGPPSSGFTVAVVPEINGQAAAGEPATLSVYSVEPSYFDVVGLRPVAGRLFDSSAEPGDVVITESLARRYWGDVSPIGSVIAAPHSGILPRTVVGVVPHVRTHRDDLGGPSAKAFSMFEPLPPTAQRRASDADPTTNAPSGLAWEGATMLVRLREGVSASTLLAVVRSVDPGARYAVQPLAAAYASRHAETRMVTAIVMTFAGVAFVIAGAGVFGLLAFLVASRTREIGVRMALGADRRDVGRLVVGSSLRLVGLGVAVGLAATVVASRWVEAELFGVTGTDPLTLTAVSGVVLLAGLVAAWAPARRASRIDPAITLRAE